MGEEELVVEREIWLKELEINGMKIILDQKRKVKNYRRKKIEQNHNNNNT